MFDEEQLAVLRGRRNAFLATLMSDGSPQLTPVWLDVDGDELIVDTAEGTVKLENMRADSRVAVNIESESDRYRVLSIRGRVIAFESDARVDEHIGELSLRHDGIPWEFAEGEDRVRVRISADRVSWV